MSEFEQLAARVAALEHRVAGIIRYGTVDSVQPDAGTVRLNLGSGVAGPVFSKRVPYAQTAGAMKYHNPPSVGQQMMLVSPGGDMRQGVALPYTWSDQNTSPGAEPDDHVLTFGPLRVSNTGDVVHLTLGGTSIRLDTSNIKMDSGRIDLNKG